MSGSKGSMLSGALLGSKDGLHGLLGTWTHGDNSWRDGLGLRFPAMGTEKAGDVGRCINHNIVPCLMYIKTVVECEEAIRPRSARALRLSGNERVDMFDELGDGCGIRTGDGKVINLSTDQNTDAINKT